MIGKVLAGAMALVATVGTASALTTYATDAPYVNQEKKGDGGDVAANRSIIDNLIGGPADGNFFSLGIGGEVVLKFGGSVISDPNAVVEVTYGNANNYEEYLEVYFATALQYDEGDPSDLTGFTTASSSNPIFNGNAQGTGFVFDIPAGDWVYILLRDVTAVHSDDDNALNGDGFDIDAVWVTTDPTRTTTSVVPLPAGVWLLGATLAGLGVASRRRRKAA